jgi:hypothetical protein
VLSVPSRSMNLELIVLTSSLRIRANPRCNSGAVGAISSSKNAGYKGFAVTEFAADRACPELCPQKGRLRPGFASRFHQFWFRAR